ncbi:MAG: Holliday junction DNA helicase RuvA [Desulfosarcina sp.]|nr:Holliday junction DNA helicase RuvA [Desulfobacterales bacterium]
MIAYIQGALFKKDEDRVMVLANQIGYEILLPAVVMKTLHDKAVGDEVSFHIFYHQTERQPKPTLIGFNMEIEKEFFQRFISVEDIGPLKAVKALSAPVRDIARAIEEKDIKALRQLKGIGNRTAQKIIATLTGKMDKFALIRKGEESPPAAGEDFSRLVLGVLTQQLGHKSADARRMVAEALKRNPAIANPEDLFDEIYRGEEFA